MLLALYYRTVHPCVYTQEATSYRYHGGHNLLESLPVTSKYSDVVTRLSKKAGAPVAIKYQLPCEDLDPDNLISVGDDEDLQEMVEEYERALQMPGTPVKTYRLRVFLFPAGKVASSDHLVTGGSRYVAVHHCCFVRTPPPSRATSRVMTTEGKSSFGSNASSKSLDNLDADVRDAFSAGFEAGLAAHQLQVQHDLMDTEMNTDATPAPTRSVHMLHDGTDDGVVVEPPRAAPPLDVHLPEHISAFGDALLNDAALLGLRNKLTPGTWLHDCWQSNGCVFLFNSRCHGAGCARAADVCGGARHRRGVDPTTPHPLARLGSPQARPQRQRPVRKHQGGSWGAQSAQEGGRGGVQTRGGCVRRGVSSQVG